VTNYKFNVTMNQNTVNSLTNAYTMFGMQSTKSSGESANTRASAWMLNTTYGLTTSVGWSIGYGMYTGSHQVLSTGQNIDTNNPYTTEVDLKDLLYVENESGTGVIKKGAGSPNSLEVYNSTGKMLSCGTLLNNQPPGKPAVFSPTCIFDLHGHTADTMQPIQKVLFFFATEKYNQGAVIESAQTDALLVDFTNSQTRTVQYDIDAGWSEFNPDTDQLVPAFADLTTVLITVSSDLTKEASRRGKKQLAGT
jgi:hypothetical protein